MSRPLLFMASPYYSGIRPSDPYTSAKAGQDTKPLQHARKKHTIGISPKTRHPPPGAAPYLGKDPLHAPLDTARRASRTYDPPALKENATR